MKRRFWPWWRWGLTGLSVLGLAFSSYLSWHYLVGGSVFGCDGGSACDQILNSRWSSLLAGLPVSGLATGAYLAMLVASLFVGVDTEGPVRRLAWRAMLVLAGAAVGSAVWFIGVQIWIIGAFCPYCMATHVIGLLLASLLIWQAPKQIGDGANARRDFGLFSTMGTAAVGMALAGIIAVCQISFAPRAIYRGGESPRSLSALDPHSGPIMGSPDAPYVVALLFDYNCPHCQQLHLMLDGAIRLYKGKVAFALCPTPLNTNCNPYVPRNVDEFANSCALAKLALAVWAAKHEAFPGYDRWMFSFESGDRWRPRTLDDAKAKAVALIGREKLEAALNDPWIDRYLQGCIRVYGNTIQGGNNAVPKLVFGSRWIIPQLYAPEDVVAILHDSLAVPRP